MSRTLAGSSRRAAGRLALVVLFLASGREAGALDPSIALVDYARRLWRTADGLPHNSVRQVIQSRDGYLWLGTPNGLARFDGVRFTVFNRWNTPGMRDDEIQALFEDRKGQIWFGTRTAGLGRMRGAEVSFFGEAEGLVGPNVYAVGEDRGGGIWVGTTAGLTWLDGERARSFTVDDGLASNNVRVLHRDRTGRLWVGAGGLHRFESGRFERVGAGLLDGRPRALCEDRHGDLWLGTGDGLRRVRDGKITTEGVPSELTRREIRTLHVDREGSLWIGTADRGLYRLRGEQLWTLTEKDGLAHDTIFALQEDREGNLWVGSRGGLERLKEPAVTLYTTEHGLSSEHIKTVYEDRRQDLWIGTERGLVRRRAGRFETWRGDARLENASVWTIHEDGRGALWIGTRRDGLWRIASGTVSRFTVEDGLSSDEIRVLHADARGDLWIGAGRGLNRFRGGRFTRYTEADGLVGQNFRAIAEDGNGDLWFGTDDGGLQRYRDGRFSTFTSRDGLANDAVRALRPTSDGALWIGTSHGLSRLKDGRFTSYRVADGLFDDTILQVLEDGHGHLWMSSGRGVFRVSLAQLEDLAAGTRRSLVSTAYGEADGMRSSECEGGTQPAGVRARDGRLWFPTTRGLAVIDPAKVRPNEMPPPVVIEDFRVNGEAIGGSPPLRLPAGKERFEFHYTGLSLTAPDKVRFRYRLHGLDGDWIDAADRRVAYYTTIPPGRYRFQVVASNNDGVWNERGASVEFELGPRFRQTAAFYLLCGVGAALVAVGWHRLRVRQMRTRFTAVLSERSRMAGEVHDTVLQGFTALILHLAAFVRELPEPQRARLGRLLTEAEDYLEEARLSIWDMRAETDRTLSDALARCLEPLRAQSPVPVRIDVQGTPRRLPGARQLHVLRVAREAVTNALQHARATAIQVHLAFRSQEVCLRVADDGLGFEPEALASRGDGHYGLLGMRERAQRLGVALHVHSEPGKGTEITLAVPDAAGHGSSPPA
jgi:ligand-binding sensor domain-containing protein/signal transduction histidine kinase